MTVQQKIEMRSNKPACKSCRLRVYGVGKDGGWWCSNCGRWIVPPSEEPR
jgi:tRNA(Ile2) C34 agmatinyltransferase TiaS